MIWMPGDHKNLFNEVSWVLTIDHGAIVAIDSTGAEVSEDKNESEGACLVRRTRAMQKLRFLMPRADRISAGLL